MRSSLEILACAIWSSVPWTVPLLWRAGRPNKLSVCQSRRCQPRHGYWRYHKESSGPGDRICLGECVDCTVYFSTVPWSVGISEPCPACALCAMCHIPLLRFIRAGEPREEDHVSWIHLLCMKGMSPTMLSYSWSNLAALMSHQLSPRTLLRVSIKTLKDTSRIRTPWHLKFSLNSFT